MEFLHIPRFEACWYTPLIFLVRMQRAYLENQGESQDWGKSRLDIYMEMEQDAKQS
jgi:hypothetical protein